MAAKEGPARAVRGHALLILLMTGVMAAAAYGVSLRFAPETYRSAAVVLVEARAGVAAPAMGTEKELARSAVVIRLAAASLGTDPDRLARGLQVSVVPDASLLTFAYRAAEPAVAQSRAQAVADAYVGYRNAATATNAPAATLVDAADTPGKSPAWPLWLVLAIGALAGLAMGVGAALLRSRTGDRIRSRGDVQRITGLTVLATVPRTRRPRGPGAARPVLLRAPQTPAAESYRYLRSRLQPLLFGSTTREGGASVLIAGAREGEGRSTTAANLAIAFAQAGRSVVLVDADLRRPRLHDMFEVPAGPRADPDVPAPRAVDLAGFDPPSSQASAQDSPGFGGPSVGAPSFGGPGVGAPGFGGPSVGATAFGAPGVGATGFGAPGHGSPSFNAPRFGRPDFNEPRPDPSGFNASAFGPPGGDPIRPAGGDEPGGGGLTGVLGGRTSLADALRETLVPRLRLLPSGPRTAETADLLDGPALADLMRALRRECDVIVIDSAALLSVSDALGLAAFADRVLLVGDYRRGARTALVRALAELGEVAYGNVSGVLVNLPARAGGLIPRPGAASADRKSAAADRFAALGGPADGPAPPPKPATASTVYVSRTAVPGG